MPIKIGTLVRVKGTNITGKVTHIRWAQKGDYEPNKYKVEGKYWNESSISPVKYVKKQKWVVRKGQKYRDIIGELNVVTGVGKETIGLKTMGGTVETIVRKPTFYKQYSRL